MCDHLKESTLPRACAGECGGVEDLSPEVRSHLSELAQKDFVASYNKAFVETKDETKAEQQAWAKIKEKYDEDENGIWSKEKVSA